MPLISVIIPVYNVEKYLDQCVSSVLQQNFTDLEVILVDDGSSDLCPKMCNFYAVRDKRVKVIHQENGGLSCARNRGIQEATGDYLMFLDSDDWWNEKVSLKMIAGEVCAEPQIEMFLFNSIDFHPELGYLKRADHNNFSDLKNKTSIEFYEILILSGNMHESACTKILKKQFIIDNNLIFQVGLLGEDTEWFFRVMRCINEVTVIDVDLFICRCQREGSITNSIGFKNVEDIILVIQQSMDYYDNMSSFSKQIKMNELAQCSYLWFILLSGYALLKKNERKLIKPKIRAVSSILEYAKSKKTKRSYLVYSILGVELTSKLMAIYVYLMKRNFIPKKKRKLQ